MLLSNIKRYMSEKITSVEDEILYYQEGKVAGKINANYLYLPCGIKEPVSVQLTPVKLGSVSANGVGLFTTAVGYEIESLDNLKNISDLDGFTVSTAYNVGTVVKDSTGSKAYVCHTAYTSGGSATLDVDKDTYWFPLKETKFVKVNCTAPGSGKVVNVNFKIEGYQ